MKHTMTWRRFGLSLIDSGINSAATSFTVVVVDPVDFNVGAGLGKLMAVIGVSFLSGVFVFLRTHRLPGVEDA